VKHKNYTERRDELNETVTDFLSRISFDSSYMPKVLDKIDEIWKERSREIESKKLTLQKEIESLEETKNSIIKNIEKFIDFPEILKAKNEELVSINQKLNALRNEKIDDGNQKSKEGFIEFTKNILKHVSNMLQEEKNEESV
jgi:septal ring factor EnvC (AmiA/AmiB activator)